MGMFDNVYCNQPLPDGFISRSGFQTKDFDRAMETYTITPDGHLMHRFIDHYDPVPEGEWKYVGTTDPLEKIWHEASKEKAVYAERDVNFHGWFRFYAGEGKREDGTWRWHEYRAKFTDGQLVKIVSVDADEGADS
jgi:hypothetical protein